MQKTCTKCGETFPATSEYFHKHPKQSSGLHPRCKVCRKKERTDRYKISGEKEREQMRNYAIINSQKAVYRMSNWKKNNPQKTRDHNKKYRQNHKEQSRVNVNNRRARVYGAKGTHTKQDIENILIYQCGRCFYCGKPMFTYHVDHFIPLSKGGANSPDNLVLACQFCNDSKGSKLPEEWLLQTRPHVQRPIGTSPIQNYISYSPDNEQLS